MADLLIISIPKIFHTLITPTEVLSYLAAADVFILGVFACSTHRQWHTMKKLSYNKESLISQGDCASPLTVFIIACILALNITLFYNYTPLETFINQGLILFIDMLYLHFKDEIHDSH